MVGGGAGLLAGLGLLAIPGLGPVVAAGWLAATAVGAAAGAATGGLVGALVGAGVSHGEAEVYSESVRRGGTLVSVRVPDEDASRIQAILDRFKPIDPAVRGAEYRKAGWNDLRPEGGALPAERDRDRAHAPRRRAGLAGFTGTTAREQEADGFLLFVWLQDAPSACPSGLADRYFMSNMPRAGASDRASAIVVPAATLRGPAMKIQLASANQGDARLARTAAITFIGAMAIVALYFGQDVLIPDAVAVLFAFILGPAVSWVRRLLPLPLAVAVVVLGALVVAGLLTDADHDASSPRWPAA